MEPLTNNFSGHINMTTTEHDDVHEHVDHTSGFACPGEDVLRLMSGKWKPQIMGFAYKEAVRFNTLLRSLPGSSKQSLSVALRELEEARVLSKNIVSDKPLHIEYSLTEKGRSMISIFKMASKISKMD